MNTIAIIGGGPAGAMAAERIGSASAGRALGKPRVLVFEERLAWEKPCGGGLPARVLKHYPFLLDAAEEHKCVHDVELVAANGDSVRFSLRYPLVIYSRSVLNHLLLKRARQAGAEITTDRILSFARMHHGWRLRGRSGSYQADYLVLAAGARSRLRSLLTEDLGPHDFMLTFGYYAPGRSDLLRVQFFEDFEGYAWAFPRPDHLSLGVCGKVGDSDMPGMRERLHRFMDCFGYSRADGPVFSHLLPALSVDRWSKLNLAGTGWAMVGDAAGLVDPVTGEGIYFAMRSGELLADSVLEGAPDSYPDRVWADFGRKLAQGARLARGFYRSDFLGETAATRFIQFGARSRTFMKLVQDLIEGSQSYSSLVGRLYRMLAGTILDMAYGAVRKAVNSRKSIS